MLKTLQTQRGGAFADADGDGKIDENDMLTEADITELYSSLNVNVAELLGLRLYTGVFNRHLSASRERESLTTELVCLPCRWHVPVVQPYMWQSD